ncbi:MAG: ATP-binding protein [Gemmatimonadetes bacterium]|nr:ATP-binding protein [Gemmatimonadota bacterium]
MANLKDKSLAFDRSEVLTQEEGAKELEEIFSDLLPWAVESKDDAALLRENTIQNRDEIKRFLDSIYLFHIGEISVSVDAQDVADLIYKRHQAAVVAAYQAGHTLTTIISGSGGGTIDIFLGVSGEGGVKEVFEKQLQGVYSGKGIESHGKRIIDRLQEKTHGGILTGIPIQKIDGEKQTFDLSSVIRSMNGQKFLLTIVSRPVAGQEAAQQLRELMELKGQCHALANRTIGVNENAGINRSYAVQETEGESRAKGFALLYSYTKSSNHTETDTEGRSESIGRSLSVEQQNPLVMELENIADNLITRLRNGLNIGLWESFITYATTSPTTSQILSGTLAGELIKADPEALPMRNIAGELSEEVPLFIPRKRDGKSLITGNKLLSFVSSDEAALLMAPPLSSVPGYDIRVKPALSLTDTTDRLGHSIGRISEHGKVVKCSAFRISKEDVRKHIFVSGLTGSGKTTTVKHILNCLDTHFLVIESAKREYRRLLAEEKYDENLRVYTVGDSNISPIRHNPFMVLHGVSLITHIDNLKSIFYASFSLYGPMPHILEKCIYNIYQARGWNLTTGKHQRVTIETFEDCKNHRFIYPTIRDLINEVNRYVKKELKYDRELKDNIRSAIVVRLESLSVGAKGFLFNTYDAIDIEDFLNRSVVLELESLSDDDDKAFFVGLMLSLVSEYRQSEARQSVLETRDDLQHVLVIEEAHRLLKNVQTERTNEMLGNPKGKAVESFCNLIAEMRSYSQGVIVAEQIPTKIAPDVIKNTNTKIIHRLVSLDDQIAVGTGLGLDEHECRYLNQLSAGTALAHKEGMSKPVEISVFNNLTNYAIGDIRIERLGRELNPDLPSELALHESGLLESKHLQAIALRLVNSFFMSDTELNDLLPDAITTIRKAKQLTYVSDKTIEQALREWFCRILFSATLGFVDEKTIDQEVLEIVDGLWQDRESFDRGRFMYEFGKWLGDYSYDSIRDHIKKNILNDARFERGLKKKDMRKTIDKVLLVDDLEVKQEIMTAVRMRVM